MTGSDFDTVRAGLHAGWYAGWSGRGKVGPSAADAALARIQAEHERLREDAETSHVERMAPLVEALADANQTVERMREALRRAYPYVMDALRDAEALTPATAVYVREDLEQHIVPALKEEP